VSVVLPLEADLITVMLEEAPIRNRDAVSVAGEVLKYVLRATEGRLRIDHPLLLPRLGEKCLEGSRTSEGAKPSMELKLACAKRLLE
jgi:hypothetical protein